MKITRRKLLGSIAIAGASAGLGAGTFAYLSDQSTADITINVGSLELADPTPIEWSENPETDGQDSMSESVSIENVGNLPSRQVLLNEIEVDEGSTELLKALEITDVRYGVTEATSIKSELPSDSNENGILDLHDLQQEAPIPLAEMAGAEVLHADDTAMLEIDATWDYEKVPENANGATLATSIIVNGKQEANGSSES